MTHDIRGGLDRQLDAAAPPSGITADAMVAKGRRRAVAQRFGIAGGFVAGVAGLTAGVLALSSLGAAPGGQGGDDTVVGPAADQRYNGEFPHPLDQTKGYAWMGGDGYGEGTMTPETQQLSDALLAYAEGLEDVELLSWSGKDDGFGPLTEENYWGVRQRTRTLDELVPNEDQVEDPGGYHNEPTGYTQTYYAGGNFAIETDPGDEWADQVNVQVVPKGGYLEGAVQPFGYDDNAYAPYLVAGCDDYEADGQNSRTPIGIECTEAETADGERALIVAKDRNPSADGSWLRTLTAVVYQEDGTATVVTDTRVWTGDPYEEENNLPSDAPLSLTGDDLIAIAEALPSVEVK